MALPKLLVTGASGFIGSRLFRDLGPEFDAVGTANRNVQPGLERLDFADLQAVEALFRRLRPAAVVHTAALAEPDRCDEDPATCRRVNRDAVELLARLCAEAGARLVHFSTDLVFDGRGSMVRESDRPEPLSLYGRTKLEAERATLAACPDAAILRVSIVYGRAFSGRPSFPDMLVERLRRGERVRAFSDQWRTPTAVAQLPELLRALLRRRELAGVFHWTSPERVTRLDFALRLARALGLDAGLIEPLRMADSGLRAARPVDSSLDSSRLSAALGFSPWPLDKGIRHLREEYRLAGLIA